MLKKVPKLGPKAFEQCAGFLRVDGKEVLDNTAVHPESYKAAAELLTLCGYNKDDVKEGKIVDLSEKIKNMGESQVAEKLNIGLPTLKDITNNITQNIIPSPVYGLIISITSISSSNSFK